MTLDPTRYQFEQDVRTALRVPRPIDVFPLQTTVSTVFTARSDADFQIESLVASNVTGATHFVTLHLVPSGGTASGANMILYEGAIPTKENLTIFNRENMGMLQPGMTLQALCGTNDAVNIWGYGYDYQGTYSGG